MRRCAAAPLRRCAAAPLCVLCGCLNVAGVTHQIRASVAHLGFPILGCPLYGVAKVNELWYQIKGYWRFLLHAHIMNLVHPVKPEKGELVLTAPLPPDFMSFGFVREFAAKRQGAAEVAAAKAKAAESC